MISRILGTLLTRELDRVEVLTGGGVAYEIAIPRTAFERLPAPGKEIELRTYQVVREDGVFLYGFLEEAERLVFARLLSASGVGPRLALSLLSALPGTRLVRAIRERDIATLTGVTGVGRKTAERLVLDLAGKLDDVAVAPADARPSADGAEEALRALTVLGYPAPEAERALRIAIQKEGAAGTQELIRAALAHLR